MTNDVHSLAGAYALNALDDAERAAFEAHYPSCEECATEVEAFTDVAASLAYTAETQPPAHLFDSIMAEVARTDQDVADASASATVPSITRRQDATPTPLRSPRRNVLAAAAAVLVLLIGGIAIVSRDTQLPVEELAAIPDAVSSNLEAIADGQVGDIEIVWSSEQDKVAILAEDLPDPGEGRAYALWFVIDSGVAPAALFQPENGTVEVVFDVDDHAANGWGISIEPESGSDAPTSDVIFLGTLS